MVNNANGLGPLNRPIPMMPPSRNMPNQEGTKIVNGDIRKPEVRNIGSGNWTGRAAKAGHVARAANGVRVGNTPRVTDNKSRACSKHEVQKPGVWPSQRGWSPSKGRHEEDRSRQLLSTSSHSYEQTRGVEHAEHLVPSSNELSKFIKLKEEVVKRPQSYI